MPQIKKMNRKALSDVVSNVLLIMVGMVAVGIIAMVIKQFAAMPQFSPQFSCIDIQTDRHIFLDSACFNQSANEVQIAVKRNLNEKFDITNLDFIMDFDGKSSTSWTCNSGCGNCLTPELGNRKIYYFDVTMLGKPTTINLMANTCNLGKLQIKPC